MARSNGLGFVSPQMATTSQPASTSDPEAVTVEVEVVAEPKYRSVLPYATCLLLIASGIAIGVWSAFD